MATVYAGWTKDDPVLAQARQDRLEDDITACKAMITELAARDPERLANAYRDALNNTWSVENIRKILRRELDALDAIAAAEARDWSDEQQMYYELRTA